MALDRCGIKLKDTLPMEAGLLRQEEDRWRHYSILGDTVKLRLLTTDGLGAAICFHTADPDQRRQLVETVQGARFYAGWPMKNACEGRDSLIRRRSPIPQTRMRCLYDTLRHFGGEDVSKALVQSACRKEGKNLIDLFAVSYSHFDQYSNVGESFGDGGGRKKQSTTNFAEAFARSLERVPDEIDNLTRGLSGDPKLGFDFVDREVNFRRTSGGSLFEDGSSGQSSGAGGVDLWLRAHDGGLPIVGEVKAAGDTDAFLALVQALTYVCELVTRAQLERVEEHYSEHFPLGHLTNSEGPYADIYLICEGEPKLIEETHELAGLLLADRKTCLGQKIRRIVCLVTPMGGAVDSLSQGWVVE